VEEELEVVEDLEPGPLDEWDRPVTLGPTEYRWSILARRGELIPNPLRRRPSLWGFGGAEPEWERMVPLLGEALEQFCALPLAELRRSPLLGELLRRLLGDGWPQFRPACSPPLRRWLDRRRRRRRYGEWLDRFEEWLDRFEEEWEEYWELPMQPTSTQEYWLDLTIRDLWWAVAIGTLVPEERVLRVPTHPPAGALRPLSLRLGAGGDVSVNHRWVMSAGGGATDAAAGWAEPWERG
jgi:hypothetical protein